MPRIENEDLVTVVGGATQDATINWPETFRFWGRVFTGRQNTFGYWGGYGRSDTPQRNSNRAAE